MSHSSTQEDNELPYPSGIGAGTLIDTDQGHVPVDWLSVGDKVMTRDRGYAELIWIGAIATELLPVPCIRVDANGLGYQNPNFETFVTPNQLIRLHGPHIELHTGHNEALARAEQIAKWRGIETVDAADCPALYGMLFEDNQLVRANGMWVASMMEPRVDTSCLSERSAATLKEVLPMLDEEFTAARLCLEDYEIAVLPVPERRRQSRAA